MKPNRRCFVFALALCAALPFDVCAQQYAPGISVVENNSADQNEPSVAIDRTNPARVMFAWQDLRQAGTCRPGYAVSSDGGATWFRRGLITNLVNDYGCNNSCAFGKNNTIYVTSLGENDQGFQDLGAIWLSTSTDLGQTWLNPIRVSEQEMNQDRPYMCVYDAPGLQYPIIHAAWWEGAWAGDRSYIRYARTVTVKPG